MIGFRRRSLVVLANAFRAVAILIFRCIFRRQAGKLVPTLNGVQALRFTNDG